MCTWWGIFQPWNGRKSCPLQRDGWTWRRCARWAEPIAEGQTPCWTDSTYMRTLQQSNSQEEEQVGGREPGAVGAAVQQARGASSTRWESSSTPLDSAVPVVNNTVVGTQTRVGRAGCVLTVTQLERIPTEECCPLSRFLLLHTMLRSINHPVNKFLYL